MSADEQTAARSRERVTFFYDRREVGFGKPDPYLHREGRDCCPPEEHRVPVHLYREPRGYYRPAIRRAALSACVACFGKPRPDDGRTFA